ncbi:hypothetical protein GCM10009765_22040 [Fodinicola feengrottensis]|uniref:Uncharacterized protein n=1 Tax=Fodinicola feengrottensis TaxID=435914 RepID=A0ABN2GJP8_9ACTN
MTVQTRVNETALHFASYDSQTKGETFMSSKSNRRRCNGGSIFGFLSIVLNIRGGYRGGYDN